MSRTKKDILILGRNPDEVRTFVKNWFAQNKIGVIDDQPSFIKGRWGTGFLTAPKYFQVTFESAQDGVMAKTEGWITVYGVADSEFSPTAVGGRLPRREGWRAMEGLWKALQEFSQAVK